MTNDLDTAFVNLVLQRLDQFASQLESDKVTSDESRRRLHEKIDALEKTIWGLDHRLELMEKAVTSTNPVFTEYMAYKQRAIGAGMVGRWLWWLGGILISAAASAAAMYTWLTSHLK